MFLTTIIVFLLITWYADTTTYYFQFIFVFRGISWCDGSLALVYESWYKTRRIRTWIISPQSENASPRILFDRSSEDVYSDPGSPMQRRTPAGTYVIAKIKKEGDEGTYVLLNGSGATPQGNIPFLDLFDMWVQCLFCCISISNIIIIWNLTWRVSEIQAIKKEYGRVTKKSIMRLLLLWCLIRMKGKYIFIS